MKRSDIKQIPIGLVKMEELEGKDIFIFGTSSSKDRCLSLLNIPYHLVGYCDNNKALWGKSIDGVLVYSPLELQKYALSHQECIIIIASAFEYEILPQLRNELNLSNKVVLMDQLLPSGFQGLLKEKQLHSDETKEQLIKELCKEAFPLDNEELVENTQEIAVYSAPKVGNTTLLTGLGYKFKANKTFCQLHSMDRLQFSLEQKKKCTSKVKKVITGVRDAVGQNLSLLYQFLYFNCLICGDEGNDAQKVFQYYVQDSIINEEKRRSEGTYGYELEYRTPFLMQSWHDDVLKAEFGIDVYQYPFDKERGYSIYKLNGYEVLVYQMEKMSSLYDVFREFIGDSSMNFEKQNDGGEKWYAKSYKDFRKNVAFEPEYIEKTYSGKMMQHFYSEEDICKFKEKWKNQLIED